MFGKTKKNKNSHFCFIRFLTGQSTRRSESSSSRFLSFLGGRLRDSSIFSWTFSKTFVSPCFLISAAKICNAQTESSAAYFYWVKHWNPLFFVFHSKIFRQVSDPTWICLAVNSHRSQFEHCWPLSNDRCSVFSTMSLSPAEPLITAVWH